MEFKTAQYQFSHGKAPRGTGQWAFQVNDEVVWSKGSKSYGQAKKEVAAYARLVNARHVEVLP